MPGQDRDVYFVFGSACKALAGKVPLKEWQHTLTSIWSWSVSTVREFNHNADVPDFTPPQSSVLPPEPTNGPIEPPLPPPAEKPVKVPDPAPIPQEKPSLSTKDVLISDVQQQKFTAHAYKHGFSEIGLNRFLRDQGINGVPNIPLGKALTLWNAVKTPEVAQQYQ